MGGGDGDAGGRRGRVGKAGCLPRWILGMGWEKSDELGGRVAL